MKKNNIIIVLAVALAGAAIFTGCDSKKQPGKIYMPDMAYSRAIETYAQLNDTVFTDNVAHPGHEIFYNRRPVDGTMPIGEYMAYTLPNDSNGYKLSAEVKSPIGPLSKSELTETGRLFNINCAICHGAEGKANGPLATSGKIGGVANLTADAYIKMADGTMYHSINYGKNNMGSYASQLSRKQRWMIVQYIRSLQPSPAGAATDSTAKSATSTATSVKKDSTATKKG